MIMPDFLGAFYFYNQETLQTRDGEDVSIEVCEVGRLNVTSGNVVACDGLIPSTKAFAEAVKPGSYPVLLSIALLYDELPKVACAMLRLKDGMPTNWKWAAIAGQGEAVEQEDETTGYWVDCGVGCFADLDAMQTLIASPDVYNRLQKEVNQPGIKIVDFQLDSSSLSNVIVFSSGYGDGTYPTYCGYDNDANLLCFATDFGVIAPLNGEDVEPPSKYQLSLDL